MPQGCGWKGLDGWKGLHGWKGLDGWKELDGWMDGPNLDSTPWMDPLLTPRPVPLLPSAPSHLLAFLQLCLQHRALVCPCGLPQLGTLGQQCTAQATVMLQALELEVCGLWVGGGVEFGGGGGGRVWWGGRV